MKNLLELKDLIIDWANEKDLIKLENAPAQRLKLLEEVGETARAILKKNDTDIKDGIGDIFVVLVILAEQLKLNISYNFTGFSDDSEWELSDLFNEILDISISHFVLGYLNDICTKLDIDLIECANLAWNEIKDRKGKTVDGTFIKNN